MMPPLKLHLLFILMFIFSTVSVTAQVAYSVKSFNMTIAGTSTLHDWTSDVTQLEFSGQVNAENGKIKELKNVTVKIPVQSIKSTKGKIMDNKTWDAFSYDKHPVISYTLSTATISDGSLKATGTLSMAGVLQPVTMDVQYSLLAQRDIRLTGTYSIKMKDYKMNPPTAMMGTIKVGEEVTVKFDVLVTPISK